MYSIFLIGFYCHSMLRRIPRPLFGSYESICCLVLFWCAPFWNYLFQCAGIPLCQKRQFPGYLSPEVSPGWINTVLLFVYVLHVRGVNVNFVHHSMMQFPMVFFEIIRNIYIPSVPECVNNPFFDTVSYLVETHVDCYRSSFITYSMHYSACHRVVCFHWCGWQWVSHLL